MISGAKQAIAIALIGFGLSGCMTSSSQTEPSATERKVTTAILFGGTTPLPEPKAAPREYTCPTATTLEGTASYRTGAQEGSRGVSFQASINDVARQCSLGTTTLTMKVGVQGRVVLGDAGKPGPVTIPVRVAVRRLEQTVYSKIHTAQVNVSDEGSSFIVVDDGISLPLSANDPGDEFTVFVGIDPQGNKPQRQRRR